MKTMFLPMLLVAVLSAWAQEAQPSPSAAPAPAAEEKQPADSRYKAPQPGHPLDPADVETLTRPPDTSVSAAQRAGSPVQPYFYYPIEVPLFGRRSLPLGFRPGFVPRDWGRPMMVLHPSPGATVIVPLRNEPGKGDNRNTAAPALPVEAKKP